MNRQMDKKEFCIAEQTNSVCYHMTTEWCERCRRIEEDRRRLNEEMGLRLHKRSNIK